MTVFFGLLLLVVQIGFFVGSRMLTVSAVEAAARRVATSGEDATERGRLIDEIHASVPGAIVVEADVRTTAAHAHAEVLVDWSPPGPAFVPLRFEVDVTRLRVIPP
jgi:hypothetical protein